MHASTVFPSHLILIYFNRIDARMPGIPTFRGAGGMWRRFNAMDLATPEAFAENPARVWQFYHYRREK